MYKLESIDSISKITKVYAISFIILIFTFSIWRQKRELKFSYEDANET